MNNIHVFLLLGALTNPSDLISVSFLYLQIKMEPLTPQPLSEEWFQQLSALIDAPQPLLLTPSQSLAFGMILSLVEYTYLVLFRIS